MTQPASLHIPRMAVSAPFWKGMAIAAVLSVPIWVAIICAVKHVWG